jgi:hypothetical protein
MSGGPDRVTGTALVVGVGRYRSSQIQPLLYAARDARALAALLADADTCGIPQERIALLTDRRARRANILGHLSRWLRERTWEGDVALIYFAGHGTQQTNGPNEEGYLLPFDADPDDIVTHEIAMAEVAHLIDAIKARAVVVILDCCHSGHILSREGVAFRSSPRDMGLRPAAIERLTGKNRFLIAACDEGQKSIESDKHKHGLFTFHLMQGMKGKADRDGDGRVGIAELFNYVSAAVARDAREEFHCEQKPWFKGTWTDEIFLATPRTDRVEEIGDDRTLERLWRDRGADDAMTEFEKRIRDPDDAWLRSALGFLRRKHTPIMIPFLLGCLAHTSEIVRRRARSLLLGYGWPTIAEVSIDLARKADSGQGALRMGLVLDGLKAIESNPDVSSLLNRLVDLLRGGGLRDRATSLLDHKRLSADMELVAKLFAETRSPYRIERLLGPGMFTAAYLASHSVTGRPAVVRLLRPQFVADDFVRGRFYEVSERSFRYIHQSLISTRDVGALPDRQIYYTVRDFIEGVTLREILAKGKRFDPVQALEILRQMLEALTPVHQEGTPHGGIKPSNVFLSGGERVRVILGDLGLGVVYLHIDRLGYDYRYTAPEVFQGQDRLTPQADFYSIGCVGYELLCGDPPFVSDRPAELIIEHLHGKPARPSERGSPLGPSGDSFFERLLAKVPSHRFDTLEAVHGRSTA